MANALHSMIWLDLIIVALLVLSEPQPTLLVIGVGVIVLHAATYVGLRLWGPLNIRRLLKHTEPS